MFRGYLHEDARYRTVFRRRVVSQRRSRDAGRDGYFLVCRPRRRRHQVAGHLIGPFEVESALMEHPAVAEVGVIGNPTRSSARW